MCSICSAWQRCKAGISEVCRHQVTVELCICLHGHPNRLHCCNVLRTVCVYCQLLAGSVAIEAW